MGLVYGAIGLIPLLWVAKILYALSGNYRAARATGLPLVVCPYDPDGVSGLLSGSRRRPAPRCPPHADSS